MEYIDLDKAVGEWLKSQRQLSIHITLNKHYCGYCAWDTGGVAYQEMKRYRSFIQTINDKYPTLYRCRRCLTVFALEENGLYRKI
jgi:hypothetical protein